MYKQVLMIINPCYIRTYGSAPGPRRRNSLPHKALYRLHYIYKKMQPPKRLHLILSIAEKCNCNSGDKAYYYHHSFQPHSDTDRAVGASFFGLSFFTFRLGGCVP